MCSNMGWKYWMENFPSAFAKAMAGQDGWKSWTRQAGCLRYGFQGLEKRSGCACGAFKGRVL